MKTIIILFATTSLYAGYYLYSNYYKKEVEFGKASLQIITGNDTLNFNIKVAEKYNELEKGLMYVDNLPENEGMIFIYPEISIRHMWMKNTFIPLDMLFIDEDNSIVHIKKNATPHSEELISSIVPIKYTIELKGGITEEKNIKIGDKIKFEKK